MGFNFPNSPTPGTQFSPAGGPIYVWDGSVWKMSGAPNVLTADSYNRVVNGAFQHSQELGNAGTSTNGIYFVDQWLYAVVSTGMATAAQVIGTYSPGKYHGRLLVNTADTSIAAGEYAVFMSYIEGSRISDFNWGSAFAKPAVLRFTALAVNAASQGTYAVSLRDSSNTVSYVAPFTLSNTSWNDIAIPIPACTIGTWATDNSKGATITISFMCGTGNQAPTNNAWVSGSYFGVAGQSNGLATAANDFRIASVGLYLDPQATGVPPPWVIPDYASELAACMRYYHKVAPGLANMPLGPTYNVSATVGRLSIAQSVPMRVAPSIGYSAQTDFLVVDVGGTHASTAMAAAASWAEVAIIDATTTTLTSGQGGYMRTANSTAWIAFSARM